MADPTVHDVFNLLDELRHQHGYRLEPAAAPFFTMFLSYVLEDVCETKIKLPIIPEFPIRKNSDNRESYKADYFALSSNRESAFLVELKTDIDSLDDNQNKYLGCATKKKMHDLLGDIKYLAKASDKQARQKYFHILKKLECLKLITMNPELEHAMFRDRSHGVYELIDKIHLVNCDFCPKVIYILPNCSFSPKQVRNLLKGAKIIGFCKFAKIVEKRGEMGKRFAESLRRWIEQPAGTCSPDV